MSSSIQSTASSNNNTTTIAQQPTPKRVKKDTPVDTQLARNLDELKAFLTETVEKREQLTVIDLANRQRDTEDRVQRLFNLLKGLPATASVSMNTLLGMPQMLPPPPPLANEIINNNNIIEWTLFFDGGSQGNPGVSGSGWCLAMGTCLIGCGWTFLGNNQTNNYAEYWALVEGLSQAKTLAKDRRINLSVRGDSMLVVMQCRKEWMCKAENLKPLRDRVLALIASFPGEIDIGHIPRAENACADYLSNVAMNSRQSGSFAKEEAPEQLTLQYLKNVVEIVKMNIAATTGSATTTTTSTSTTASNTGTTSAKGT
jgi:ribonuclease HI